MQSKKDPESWKGEAKRNLPTGQAGQKKYKRFLENVDRNKALKELPALHEAAFAKHDCLQCAACCKNYSPRFKTPDIKRISKVLGLRESAFIEKYLQVDEEGDFVLQKLPCAFLDDQNYCTIYQDRPSDCRRFPYTDEDVFLKRTSLTLKNISFCPISFDVIENLMKNAGL